ncbi:putative peptidase, PmbA-like protein [Candidatus Terasakiella magnetica]|uniref:Putative peptidase, PmbA-like protein n=1 Tax=Candidatus Terasakiella magnetica TaxID=1867952 RepID=A0A1C3RF13_9PROT|nr:metallopeptidase TldD-related protein [Candidatus Terasakiella magnetica]SCA55859.1 putative peptidase, PmbA-like protein [Candidatus Terasakiella magnetica]
MSQHQNNLDLLNNLIEKAQKLGAESADAVLVQGTSLSLSQRLGKPENLERSEGQDMGLRVFIGKRQAIVSSSDFNADALDELAQRCVDMARVVPEDPYCGLADPDQLATEFPDVEGYDPYEPDEAQLIDWATKAEESARAVEGVTNSEGAEASWGRHDVAIAASNGLSHAYSSSGCSISASVLAGSGTEMERDYEYTSAVFAQDLDKPEEVGLKAGEKAVARLNPRKVETQQVPIIYSTRVSNGILGHLTGAINGNSVARGTSFLKDRMDERIFGSKITIVDDPHRKRGLRSKPIDGEGLANQKREIIKDGVLNSWILDLRSARQLGLESTGHAARGTGSPPSPSTTNFYMEAGEHSLKEMIGAIKQGFYVTELIGMGVNTVTGDYSRGAAGFWIENGEIVYPVSELTIAGNLKDMFMNLTPADDLEFKYGTNAPSLRIDGLTVAGQSS